MSNTPETDAAELIYDGMVASGYADSDICRKLERERNEARKQLRVAVGLLSTTPKFQDQHPEEVLKFVEEAAK